MAAKGSIESVDDTDGTGSETASTGQLTGALLVVLSACAFGSGPLLVQGPYAAGMAPFAILYWRFLVAAALAWLVLLASERQRRALRSMGRRRVVVLVLLGMLYVGNSGTYTAALEVVPITLTTIITYLYPGLVAVLSTRYLRRLRGRRAWAGLSLSTVGVALAVGGIPQGDLPPAWGLALAMLSPVIYAAWIVLQARLTGDRPSDVTAGGAETAHRVSDVAASGTGAADALRATAVMTSATCASFALLLVMSGGSPSPAAVPGVAWPGLLGFGAVATALAITTFYAGVSRIGGARAALISTVEPVYTITLATLLFGEALTPLQVVGGLLVIGGVLLAESGQRGAPLVVAPGDHAAAS